MNLSAMASITVIKSISFEAKAHVDMSEGSMKEMGELLRKGARMMSEACPECGTPLFRFKGGEIVCPSCNRPVKVVKGDETQESLAQQGSGVPQRRERRRHRLFHQVDQAANKVERPLAKGQLQAQVGAKEIGDHRKAGALDRGEQQGRPSLGDHPSMDLGDFKMGIDRSIDGEQLVVGAQQIKELAQIDKSVHADPGLK